MFDTGSPVVFRHGGFGTCTDEAVNYTMEGVPIDSYIVVAGRDFCGPHDYHESSTPVELTDFVFGPQPGGVGAARAGSATRGRSRFVVVSA